MRHAALVLLLLTSQAVLAAINSNQNMSNFNTATEELRRTPATTPVSPGIRACSYYDEGSTVINITRLNLHSKSCQSEQSIDNQLPDRPETDIYKVGEPFDVPKRN